MNIRKIRPECVDWIHLTIDKYQWRTLVSKVMNIRVP